MGATAGVIAALAPKTALQPWADAGTLYSDTERMLPHTDPFNRQITFGLGCFVELARIGYGEVVPPSPRWPLEAKLI